MTPSIAIMILADGQSQAARTALQYTKAALALDCRIECVFFYHQGVQLASNLAVYPQDELDIQQSWQALIVEQQLPAVVCIASALKRGLLDETEATRYQKPAHNLHSAFSLAGLGSWLDAVKCSDQHIIFKA